MNLLLLLTLISNPSWRATVTLGAGGNAASSSSGYHQFGGINISLHGFLFAPQLLSYRAQVGLQQSQATYHTTWGQRKIQQSNFPYTFALRIQPNHEYVEVGIQRRWISRSIWDGEPVRASFEGVHRRLWLLLRHGGSFFAQYSREFYENSDVAHPQNIFEETFSSTFSLSTRRSRFVQRIFYRNFDDVLSDVRWRHLSFQINHRYQTQRLSLSNNGAVNWWNHGIYASWNSGIQALYGERGVLSFHWTESLTRPWGEESIQLGTGFRVSQAHRFRSSLRFTQSITFWDLHQERRVRKLTWSAGFSYRPQWKWAKVSLTPRITYFRGTWDQRTGNQVLYQQGLGVSPRLPSALYGIYPQLSMVWFWGWQTEYFVQRGGSPKNSGQKLAGQLRISRFPSVQLILRWERAKGRQVIEAKELLYDYTHWSIGLQFRRLPVVLYFREGIDHIYRGWSQSLWLRYQGRFLGIIPFHYNQIWARANNQGQVQHYWEHQVILSQRIFLLYIQGEAYFRLNLSAKQWSTTYRIMLVRAFGTS